MPVSKAGFSSRNFADTAESGPIVVAMVRDRRAEGHGLKLVLLWNRRIVKREFDIRAGGALRTWNQG